MDRNRRRSPPRRAPDRGRPGPVGYGDERRRSRSPMYGRSSSPYSRRSDRDFGNAYRDYGRGGRGDAGPYDSYMEPPSRPEHSPERAPPTGPNTFKQFLLSIDDDPEPEEAQKRYKAYLVEYHGSEIKAEFEQTRKDERVQALYDPRAFEKTLAKRNQEAAESFTRFKDDLASHALDATAPAFHQGAYELAPKHLTDPGTDAGSASKAVCAPPVCWKPARIASDIALSRRLIRRLDFEKGLGPSNPLLPATEASEAAQTAAQAQDVKDAEASQDAGKPAPTGSAKHYVEAEEPAPDVTAANYAELVSQLDLQLTYLWRVHGVDFYAGYELAASEFAQRLTACRLLRGAKPSQLAADLGSAAAAGAADMAIDGGTNQAASTSAAKDAQGEAGAAGATAMHTDDAAGGASGPSGPGTAATPGAASAQGMSGAEAEQEAAAAAVDACWVKRITEGDPLEAKCQRAKVEELLDAWVESQILLKEENKWANKLSSKMFRAKQFVVKHIRTKHEEKLLEEKAKILDELYWENFKAGKEEEARQAEAAARAARGDDNDDNLGRGGRGGRAGRRGRGGGERGGRGDRGGGRGQGLAQAGMMPGMPGMPLMMPGGLDPMAMMGGMSALPPMPGMPALPMVNPVMAQQFLMQAMGTMAMAAMADPAAMGMGMGMGMGRGMGMGMGHGGGRGPPRRGPGMREYYDLDNPSNNRAVIDYGDLQT